VPVQWQVQWASGSQTLSQSGLPLALPVRQAICAGKWHAGSRGTTLALCPML
jgi:hypothetical protein